MRIVWEKKDIVPGRKYRKPNTAETWMIGYMSSREDCVSVSLSDGLVTSKITRKQAAENLTQEGYVPLEFMDSPVFRDEYSQKPKRRR